MCGIVAYIGKKAAQPLLLEGLRRLEYRGYDSAGVGLLSKDGVRVTKNKGRIATLCEKLEGSAAVETIGIGHTRWATHGEPNTINAHPHMDFTGKITIVHNGIIENYNTLKKWLQEEGYSFKSETDTEVLANLIGYFYSKAESLNGQDKFEWAVQRALNQVHGTYGLAILCSDYPDRIIAAKKGSPLLVGVGDDEYIIASDASAIVEHTTSAFYLADDEMAVLNVDSFKTQTIQNKEISKEIQKIDFSLDEIELGGFEHYMLKEIFEQPEALATCLKGRIDLNNNKIILGGISELSRALTRAKRFILTGCGTAWHACLVGEFMIEQLARIPVEVEYASELRYRNPIIEDGTVVIAVSQSGETADTLAAIEMCKERGATVLGIVNVVGSTIARTTDAGVYLRVGPEIGVASTKAFTAQVSILAMLAIELGRRRHLDTLRTSELLNELNEIPNKIGEILKYSDQIKEIAKECCDKENWLFLGRGFNYPTALEGALKLKEISYIHAEGLPAAEMKHGPIALITDGMPAVFIATRCSHYEKIISNIEEVRARGGRTIVIANEGDGEIEKYADYLITIPKVDDAFEPLLAVLPLQLLAYHCAVLRGHDVDKPRNLAKSVTVE
ncbi:MAG: glutamine--fructose-6-phosphate transaminase (isomerizing) [Sedimentisphaeraceae bacterium JB056]